MDKKLIAVGSLLIVLLVGGLFLYQYERDESEVVPQTETVEQTERAETISGYEEPEGLVTYMLCRLQQEDLDLALRGCAIPKLAENFNLESYITYTETYDPLGMLPPANWDSTAYIAISKMRMAGYYTQWLQKCMEQLGASHEVKLLDIVEDIPETPDGMYYERRNSICDILGSRSIREMLIHVKVDGQVKELRWTLVRYGKYWNVLLFTSLDGYGSDAPDIQACVENLDLTDASDLSCEEILPVNYGILNANGEKTPEDTISRFFKYLMRQDVWSAASYVKVYELGEELHTTADLVNRETSLAEQLQAFYYRLFFNDQNRYEWYFRALDTRGGDIVEDLRSDKIITMAMGDVYPISEVSEERMDYQVTFNYGWVPYGCIMHMINENGWRIESIEWQ